MAGYEIRKNAGVWWPVRWDEAADDGQIVAQEIRAKFIRLGRADAAALNEQLKDGTVDDAAFVKKVLLDWDGPTEGGVRLPLTDENVAAMMDVLGFIEGLAVAFWQMTGRIVDERAGNSNGSPSTGPAAGEPTADQPPTKPS